jgi:hypothetical protein
MRSLEHRESGKQEGETPSYFHGSGHAAGDLGFTIGGVIVEDGGAKLADGTLVPESEYFSPSVRVSSDSVGCYANKKAMLDHPRNLVQFSSKIFGVE